MPLILLHVWRTEAGDQRGDEWEPIKISSKFESSAYVTKSPKPSSVLTKVWSSYWKAKPTQKATNVRAKPRSKSEANREKPQNWSAWTGLTGALDRSDRCTGPVWPVSAVQKLADRSDRSCLPVWPVAPRKPPKTWIQTMNLNQTTTKIDETWGIASPLPREHIPKRSRPKDQQILRIRGEIKKDWGFLKNSRTPILKS